MKNRVILIMALVTFCVTLMGQAPQSFKYQAVARSNQGNVLENQSISVRFQVINDSSTGAVLYSELHTTQTNRFGTFNLEVGLGTPESGSFNAIPWNLGSKFLETQVSTDGGVTYINLGTSPLLSVPYALQAERAQALNESPFPAGMLIPFAGDTSVIPNGWLLCDGSEVNRAVYNRLFTAIGTNWGAGDSTTTFHLPDMRGRFLRGVDLGAGNDTDTLRQASNPGGNSGNLVGSVQDDGFESHNHNGSTSVAGEHSHSYSDRYSDTYLHHQLVGNVFPPPNVTETSPTSTGATTAAAGNHSHSIASDGIEETRPKNVYVNYLIKY